MTQPTNAEGLLFYRAAKQRLEDARFLLEGARTTAAVDLAGYAVECMLKAMILSAVPANDRGATVASSRGGVAHDYGWLRRRYLEAGGPAFPPEVARDFARVNTWGTDMRYQPGTARRRDAVAFIDAVDRIVEWADRRL